MDVIDCLKVKVIEAEALISPSGLLPSPYVEIVLGQQKQRTRHIVDSKAPSFSSEPPLIFERVLAEGYDTLLVYVFHKDPFAERPACLGLATISLDTFLQSPKVDVDYWYDLSATFEMSERVEGSRIRLLIQYNNEIDKDFLALPTNEASAAPNLLQITVHSSADLTGAAMEAFVEVEVGNLRKQSKISKKAVNPVWNDSIEMPIMEGNETINITLKQATILRNVFIGRFRLSMNEVAAAGDAGMTKSFPLLNENFQFSEANRGEIQLSFKWTFDKATDEENRRLQLSSPKKGIFSKLANILTLKKERSLEEDGDEERSSSAKKSSSLKSTIAVNPLLDSAGGYEVSQYSEEQRQKRQEEANYLAEHHDELEEEDEQEMPEGDYTIQVHVIEVTNLIAQRSSGSSDPVVFVEVLGQVQRTKVAHEVVSDNFFDEVFYFSFKDLKKEQLAQAHVKISVFNHSWFRSNQLIGVYQLDLPSIYSSGDHELYRRWAVLRDPTTIHTYNNNNYGSGSEEFMSGSQGLMKYSVVCLGPGDSQKVHDPTNEEEEDVKDLEINEGAAVPDDLGDVRKQTLHFLVIGMLRVEGLPGFDRLISSLKHGLYAFVKLEFAGCKPMKTTKVSVSGKSNLTVVFEEEVWIPVWIPTLSQRLAVTIMNREFPRNDQVVATAYLDFDAIPRMESNPVSAQGIFGALGLGGKKYSGPMLQWVHFYGANSTVRGGPKAAQFMNKFPNHGSAFRGSMLTSLRIVKHPDGGNEAAHKVPMDYDIPDSLIPQNAMYLLRVMIYQGSDFGSTGTQSSTKGFGGKYSLRINIGPHEVRSSFRTYEDGSVDWAQLIEVRELCMCAEYRMLPDTFLTVYRGSSDSNCQSVAYTRLKTIDILPRDSQARAAAQWFELKHDVSHKSTNTIGYPGSVLLKLSLANMQDIVDVNDWEPERKKIEMKKPFCLRVFVYQCKDLPAVDDNYLIDPYVKIRFAGQKQKTASKKCVQNPAFFEMLEFHQMLPEDLHLAPHVLIQVWDNKTFSRAPVAAFRQALVDIPVSHNPNTTEIPTPTWKELTGIDGNGKMGKILVSFQLFLKKEMKQVLPSCRDITPVFKKVFLDIHVIGLRNLKYKRNKIRKSFLQFDVCAHAYGEKLITSSSRSPSPNNPNYLDRHIVMVNMPEDPLYTPTLEVRCFDERMSTNVLLGFVNIDLATKLPWNTEEYKPPRQHEIMENNMKARNTREVTKRDSKTVKTLGKGPAIVSEKTSLLVGENEDSEEEEKEDDLTQSDVPDSGLGVFPAKFNQSGEGTGVELPSIFDEEETEERDKRALTNSLGQGSRSGRLRNQEQDFDKIDLTHSAGPKTGELNRIIGIPSTWANADFLKGREWWIQSKKKGEGGDLENYIQTYPFENYELVRGHIAFNKFGKRRNTLKKVGLLKAVIRVCMKNPRYDEEYGLFNRSIRQQTKCLVRLYVIKAQNLQPNSLLGGWLSDLPSPYLKVSLGDKEIKDTKAVQASCANPTFFRTFEFTTDLPGPSLLNLKIMDRNLISSDTLLGETVVDLEDRWFHPKWTLLEQKPLEVRTLRKEGGLVQSKSSSQGVVLLWIDIFPQREANKHPPVLIFGPEKLKFELRIVCWRSIEAKIPGERFLDLFSTFSLDGHNSKKESTDVHWRCKNGAGSWNYRIKIPIELPIENREEGRLHIQLWSKGIFNNKIVGEAVFNLYDWFMLTYHRKTQQVQPFKELEEAKRKLNSSGFSASALNDASVGDRAIDDILAGRSAEQSEYIQEEDLDALEGNANEDNESSYEPLLGSEQDTLLAQSSMLSAFTTPKSLRERLKQQLDGRQRNVVEKPSQESHHKVEEEEEDDTKGAVDMIKQFLGVGDAIPEDAHWFPLSYKERDAGKVLQRGRLAVSISILPEAEALNRPAGYGRDEPNSNPYLPPPVGRFSFTSMNPLSLISGLFGPKVVCILVCVCSCLCCLGCFMFLSVYLTGIESIINVFKGL